MATLYIHIGTPKTGTTSIQNFLLLNETEMAKKKISHPHIELGDVKEKFKSRRNGNFLVYKSSLLGEEKEQEENRIYQTGFTVIQEEAKWADKIIISDEAIWYRQNEKEDFWEKIKEDAGKAGCDVKVVVYLRRQDLYVQAEWNQAIKYVTRWDSTFKKYLKSKSVERRNLDYFKTLNKIADVIGLDNVIVRVFEKENFIGVKAGIYVDFLGTMGLTMEDAYCLPEENQNERLDGNFIEIKRLINKIPEYKEMEKDFIFEPILRANSLEKPEKVSYFRYDEQIKFMNQYQESNRLVAEKFLGKKDGELFSEEIEKLPKWEVNRETMYRDIIRTFAEVALEQENRINMLNERLGRLEWELHNPLVHMVMLWRKILKKIKR